MPWRGSDVNGSKSLLCRLAILLSLIRNCGPQLGQNTVSYDVRNLKGRLMPVRVTAIGGHILVRKAYAKFRVILFYAPQGARQLHLRHLARHFSLSRRSHLRGTATAAFLASSSCGYYVINAEEERGRLYRSSQYINPEKDLKMIAQHNPPRWQS